MTLKIELTPHSVGDLATTCCSHLIRQANNSAFLSRVNAGLGLALLKITDEDERRRIAEGADILMTQFIFDDLYHPIQMEVSE